MAAQNRRGGSGDGAAKAARPAVAQPEAAAGPPATVAVALESEPGSAAPKVVASGRGWVAEQILALAFANGVKVRQDSDLVQILSAIDIDSDIPPEAFVAVSEILAYVYRANGAAGYRLGDDGQ